jgi:hypothetical protein
MPRKPQSPPLPPRWSIYKLAARQTWIGEVEAASEAEKAAAKFKLYAPKPMAVRAADRARHGGLCVCEHLCSAAGSFRRVTFLRFLRLITSPAWCDDKRVPLSAVAAMCGVNWLALYRMLWTGRVSDDMAAHTSQRFGSRLRGLEQGNRSLPASIGCASAWRSLSLGFRFTRFGLALPGPQWFPAAAWGHRRKINPALI